VSRQVLETLPADCCDDGGHSPMAAQMDKDPHVEPAAGDLAGLTLDLPVPETGARRRGVTPTLLFDDPDAAPPPGAP
jgi:formate dehydrogenase maturation protein FdhE